MSRYVEVPHAQHLKRRTVVGLILYVWNRHLRWSLDLLILDHLNLPIPIGAGELPDMYCVTCVIATLKPLWSGRLWLAKANFLQCPPWALPWSWQLLEGTMWQWSISWAAWSWTNGRYGRARFDGNGMKSFPLVSNMVWVCAVAFHFQSALSWTAFTGMPFSCFRQGPAWSSSGGSCRSCSRAGTWQGGFKTACLE